MNTNHPSPAAAIPAGLTLRAARSSKTRGKGQAEVRYRQVRVYEMPDNPDASFIIDERYGEAEAERVVERYEIALPWAALIDRGEHKGKKWRLY